jgi:hypothetical protein
MPRVREAGGLMKIFAEHDLAELLKRQHKAMLRAVESEADEKLLNGDESELAKELATKYVIEPITFSADRLEAAGFDRVIRFHLPFSGDAELLKCSPSARILWTAEVTVDGSEVRFDIVKTGKDGETLMREKQIILDRIAQQNAHVTNEVAEFNARLEEQARQAVAAGKGKLVAERNVLASLGIRVREADAKPGGIPQALAAAVTPKNLIIKPPRRGAGTPRDPTLDNETYGDILSIIHDVGVAMERLPSTYADKTEEDLRDLILAVLCTHYPGATGETFNKAGKTDILIRHEGSNVFVGECKFWQGGKRMHATTDQMLSYLTWRDSKAALVLFAAVNKFGPVLPQITAAAEQHPCFVRLESEKKESRLQFEFRLPSDPTRNVHLAILCFHFPPPNRRMVRVAASIAL